MWYRLDPKDRIIALDNSWNKFAVDNGAPELDQSAVIGETIWRFFAGRAARYYYEELFQASRRLGSEMTISFRCDAPDMERAMELTVQPRAANELILKTTTIGVKRTPWHKLWDCKKVRSDVLVTACSWCKRVKAGERRWLQLSEAIPKMALLNHQSPPEVSHGVCPSCETLLQAELYSEPLSA